MIAQGLRLNAFAELLEINNRTVSTHKKNLMGKLGVANTSELMR